MLVLFLLYNKYMKQLTKQEINFVKETGFTPTVFQCDEYHRTIFTNERVSRKNRQAYSEQYYKLAADYAKLQYNIDLDVFINKNIGEKLDDSDVISLEYVATYLFYCFFTKDELEKLTDKDATEFLQDYRYFSGFRKWYDGNLIYVNEAIEVYNGERVFYLQDDGNVWHIRKDELATNSYAARRVLENPIL